MNLPLRATHPAFDFVQEVGGIAEYTLRENGLQVLVLPQHVAPVATVMMTYRVGSRHEPSGLTGATHYLEHLMFKGSRRFNRENGRTVFDVLQNVGARVNATTWFDRTNYYELLPSEHVPLALDIEADRMRHALLDEDDVSMERTVILNELDRGENEPVRKLYHEVWSAAFRAHGYRHPTIGWRSDVEQVTAAGLRHFYDTYYWPDNATLSVIGAVEPDNLLTMVADRFGATPRGPDRPPTARTSEPAQRGERRVTVRMAGQLGVVMMAYKAPAARSEAYPALEMLASVLSAGKNARLYRALTDKGLATGASASVSALHDPGLFSVYALCAPGVDHAAVEQAITAELEAVVQAPVADAELERAMAQLRADELFGRDGSYSIAAQLNEAIAAGDWTLYAGFLNRAAAVTPADIQQAAAEVLKTETCTTGWYIPEPEVAG